MNRIEKLVEDTEALCDAFENLPSSITERIIIDRLLIDPLRLSIAATSANIRMFFYVTNKKFPKESEVRGFEQLKFLLTNPMSGWEHLDDDEKVAFLRHSRDIYNEVFVFT